MACAPGPAGRSATVPRVVRYRCATAAGHQPQQARAREKRRRRARERGRKDPVDIRKSWRLPMGSTQPLQPLGAADKSLLVTPFFRFSFGNRRRDCGRLPSIVVRDEREIRGICSFPPARQLIFGGDHRSEEHTSELQSHSFISYAVFCLKKKKT